MIAAARSTRVTGREIWIQGGGRVLLLALAAFAAEPVVQTGDDSTIAAWVDIPAAPGAVFAVVSNPAAVATFADNTTVDTSVDGPCVAVTTHIDHPIAKATYETRSCPDGDLAVKQTLTGEGSMKEFESRWWVEPTDGGSRLHYRIRTIPDLPVPQFVVNRTTARSAGRLLGQLRDHFAPPPKP